MATKTNLDSATLGATKAFLGRLSGRSDVVGAWLFGSRARGNARVGSDADLAIILRGAPGERFREALRLADLAFEVLLETGVLIEALPLWQEEWEHGETFSNPALIETIRRDGIPL